ncbi:MAG: hypothetical protein JNL39_01785 [Opitutaceae bacterium]|nr:hypothetical protein [Opitutaceae bacterium]
MSKSSAATDSAPAVLSEVRYSLSALLLEIQAERATSAFAMEKLDQQDIKKLFKAKATRAKSKKQ